jgi:hypothetical protein
MLTRMRMAASIARPLLRRNLGAQLQPGCAADLVGLTQEEQPMTSYQGSMHT